MMNFNRGISDDTMAFERINNIYCGPGQGIYNGPKVILYNAVRSKTWDLLIHGGFVTYTHHDMDGQMHSGAKLWFVICPESSEECKKKSMKTLFVLYDKLLPDLGEIIDEFEVLVLLLELGQVL